MGTLSTTQIATREVRISFVSIFEPRAIKEGDEPKYSLMVMVPKSDTKTVKAIKAAIAAAEKQGATGGTFGKKKKASKQPLKDGDEQLMDEDNELGEEIAGHYYFNASSKRKPQIIDMYQKAIEDPEQVYSGCYARVAINFFPYNHNSTGVAAGLEIVMKLKDGERLGGGRIDVSSAFGDNDDFDYEDYEADMEDLM